MKLAIILTATVKPAVVGGNFTVAEREEMYMSTLRFYSRTIGKKYPIVFVENSDFDISSWAKEFEPSLNLEILQFPPGNEQVVECFDNSKGKGYNEYLMIKKAISASRLLNDSISPVTHFLKITGRYSMRNILDMIKEVERRIGNRNIVYFGDIKDTCVYRLMGRDTLSSNWGDRVTFKKESPADIKTGSVVFSMLQ